MRNFVRYAKFHASVFHPKTGSLGDVLPSPIKTLPDLVMQLNDNDTMLLVSTKGSTIAIPLTNISHMEIIPHGTEGGSTAAGPVTVKMNTKTGLVGKA